MSTKTTFKRVALVAVAALGLGVLTSVAPANATANKAVSSLTAGTMPAARPGVVANLPVTAVFAASAATTDTITVAAKVISAPTGSVLYNTTSTANSAGALLDITEASSAFTDATGTFTYFTNASGLTDAQVSENLVVSGTVGTTSGTFLVALKPDVAGTYQILVSGNAATWTAGNPSTVLTVTTTGAPTSLTVSTVGKVVEGAPSGFGANIQVTLKDAAGAATVLGTNEAITVTTSNSTATTLSASTLSSPVAGVYTILVEDSTIAADGTAVITFTGSGLLPATLTSNTTVSIVDTETLTEQLTLTSATGYYGTSPTYYTSAKSSHGFTLAKAITTDADYAIVVDATGTGARDYATSVAIAAADDTAAFAISQAFSSTGVTAVSVGTSSAGTAVASPIVINREAAVANDIAAAGQTSILMATAGSATFTVGVTDQFGNAVKDSAVTVGVAGRNTVATTALGVTNADGFISYTLKDAGTTGTTDTVTFTCSSCAASTSGNTATTTAAFTVTYGTVTVGSVTVTGGATADTVAGTTKTAINGADNGPEASRVAIKAVVKDAAGNLLAGVPVVFTVDSGLVYKTASVDFATVYTGTDGSATTHVFDWKVGKQTVTATAGGVAKTGYINWVATSTSSARVLSATATGDIVSLKVVDRFGNAVSGVTVNLSRTGTGLFGNGASTQNIDTDKNGTADVRFTGSGTVVAELASTYVQAYDLAGFIAETAVTAAVAGTTKGTGATLAPAGVAKVSLAIEAGADSATTSASAAADAAAEATDAANAATDAANAAAEAADAATAAAQDAADAVAALSTQVSEMVDALKKQITALTNLVIKIQKKVKA
jgi:hypothetical protein